MPSVGLSMIVKNAEADLALCLQSVARIVDQIVVADTGSTDRTMEIAAQHGAQVISIPWEAHFSKARNASLERLTTDWALVLDADEELSAEACAKLRALLDGPSRIGGYILQQRNYKFAAKKSVSCQTVHPWNGEQERAKGANYYVDNPICRLFRRLPGVYFSSRIHETTEPQILAQGFKLQNTDLVIHHYGFLADRASKQAKDRNYYEMLKLAVQDDPNDHMNWMQLGLTQQTQLGDGDAALQSYRQAIKLCPDNPYTWASMANLLLLRQELPEAIEAARRLPNDGPLGMVRHIVQGDAQHGLGHLVEARRIYAAGFEQAQIKPQNGGEASILLFESRLGFTEVRLGMADAGMSKLRHAVDASPDIVENQDRLVKALLFLKRDVEAAEAAEAAIPYTRTVAAYTRAAALHMHAGDARQAQRLLDAGVEAFPESAKLRELRGAGV